MIVRQPYKVPSQSSVCQSPASCRTELCIQTNSTYFFNSFLVIIQVNSLQSYRNFLYKCRYIQKFLFQYFQLTSENLDKRYLLETKQIIALLSYLSPWPCSMLSNFKVIYTLATCFYICIFPL